ncbi:DUF3515 family protein [Streptomyces sp. 7R007]
MSVTSGRGKRVAVALAAAGLVAGTVLVVREANSPAHGLSAAPRGDAPPCARVTDASPDALDGRERAGTGLPGVAVWGDGAVTLRCGLAPPAATVDPCIAVDGVDWVWRPSTGHDGRRVLVTFGRDPAVEVSVSDRVAGIDEVLVELSGAVRSIRQGERCVGEDDVASPG